MNKINSPVRQFPDSPPQAPQQSRESSPGTSSAESIVIPWIVGSTSRVSAPVTTTVGVSDRQSTTPSPYTS
ncbi:hypothetical protein GCK72_000329 [Caenorhabditis remanei]|uniref:Uncharacterized protein n=1 Tax=Caenorhabditis remanei TaxID=31234 RepID=A0A6A5HQC7_CAERE|nr:hypothetical protein GCK72_000329 [Caenorhabditis remanei]KAF1768517.1 hypothetical protein GCK72_000329 [Caenorhabditis remanei]